MLGRIVGMQERGQRQAVQFRRAAAHHPAQRVVDRDHVARAVAMEDADQRLLEHGCELGLADAQRGFGSLSPGVVLEESFEYRLVHSLADQLALIANPANLAAAVEDPIFD